MKYSATVQRKKRGKRTFYYARLHYYDQQGKRHEAKRSAANSSEAKRLLKELVDKFVVGGSTLVAAKETFHDLAEYCKEHRYCEAIYDHNGQKVSGVRDPKKQRSTINRLAAEFGHLRLEDIRVAHIEAYRRKRLTDVSLTTVNRELSTMRAMLNDAVVNDWLARNPFTKAKRGELIPVALETKRDVTITHDEEQRLLAQCGGDRRKHLKALIIAAIDSGCRQGELLRLKWSDVDFQQNSFKATSYKGRKMLVRTVAMTDRTREALLSLREKPSTSAFRKRKNGDEADDTLVFGITSNVKRSFDKARTDAGLPHLRFHDLRHTAGTALANAGMHIAQIGNILGHSNPQTTARYINKTAEVVDLAREIMERRQQKG